jgi:hypothetical protein
MFFRKVREAGATISAANMEHVQSIHESARNLGASCSGGSMEALRGLEASLPMNQSHDALRGHLRNAITAAHGANTSDYYSSGPYVTDVFPKHVIYSYKGETLKRPYTAVHGADGTVPAITLGDPSKVHMAYADSKESGYSILLPVPEGWEPMTLAQLRESVIITAAITEMTVRESATFCEDFTDIKEAAKAAAAAGKPTTIPIKIIQPGWGSSAYYSKEMIQASGPKTFKKGTHMYWNHATATEEADRPEGDLNDLAAVLTKDAVWNDAGAKGPGLYSEAKVFSDYATQVEEKGNHIGVSINAAIKAHEGEAEGKAGKIADAFVYAFSTDFVTKAGAGGAAIVPALESQRTKVPPSEVKESIMDDKEAQALQTENAALKTRLLALEAGQNHLVAVATVGAVLKEAGIQFSTKLLDRACVNPTMKEGRPDPKWVEEVAADFVQEGGGVRGLGETTQPSSFDADTAKMLKESMAGLGLSEAALKYAVPEVK